MVGGIDMKTIEEIKSIEIHLDKDRGGFIFSINGEDEQGEYILRATEDNVRFAARCLTRIANVFWEKLDALSTESNENEND